MGKPEPITVDNKIFYLADDLCNFDKSYFVGCSRTVRKIVEKKKIPTTEYKSLTLKKKRN